MRHPSQDMRCRRLHGNRRRVSSYFECPLRAFLGAVEKKASWGKEEAPSLGHMTNIWSLLQIAMAAALSSPTAPKSN